MGQEPDSPQQPELLLAVLQVFGQALLQPDINTFRTSLLALEDLNTKWKLYHKVRFDTITICKRYQILCRFLFQTLFRERLLCQFITVLLHTLLDQGHALLIDDMLLTLFNMAAVNFQAFFTTFVPEFLQNMDLLTPTQRDSLKQSFNQETVSNPYHFCYGLAFFIAIGFCFLGHAYVYPTSAGVCERREVLQIVQREPTTRECCTVR